MDPATPSIRNRTKERGSSAGDGRPALARYLPVVVLAVGLVATLVTAILLRASERQQQRERFEQQARELADGIRSRFEVPAESLFAVAAFIESMETETVDRERFSRFAGPLVHRHESLAALEWATIVRDEDRAAFELRETERHGRPARIHEIDANGARVPSPKRDVHLVMLLMEPDIEELRYFDFRFEEKRRAAIDASIRRGEALATSKFRLVEDPEGTFAVAVYLPVYSTQVTPPTEEGRVELIRGLAIALFRLEPLVQGALQSGTQGDVTVRFVDLEPSLSNDERLLYADGAIRPQDLVYEHPLVFHGREWQLTIARPPPGSSTSFWIVLLVGGIGSAIAAFATATARGHRDLRRRVAELRELGEYTLERRIGEGGMGLVYEASHRLLRRPAAIKLIRSSVIGDEVRARFAREARTTSELTHPNTITVYDYGETDQGDFYLVMEYVEGVSFDELIERYAPLPPARVRHLILQACWALAEAHDRGLTHRDIKPGNLMICVRGTMHDFVKVLDFGLVKDPSEVDANISSAGAVVGTARYLAPESVLAPDTVGPAADVFALGAVAYALTTGRHPFGGTESNRGLAQLTSAPSPIDSALEVPTELETLLMRCLAKAPQDRFANARHMALALRRLDVGDWAELDAVQWWEDHATSPRPSEAGEDRITVQIRPSDGA